jgi:hemerythrin-like metal-binding protein
VAVSVPPAHSPGEKLVKDLIWNNTLSVEVDEIDEDHRRLVELYNILRNAVSAGEAPNYIEAVMEELVTCTVWHFKHEERLMIRYDYPGYEAHRNEHDDLVESARELQQKFLQNDMRISGEDITYLEHWLTGHILSTDMELGEFLAEVM